MAQSDYEASRSVVLRYNDCINARDVGGLASLMSDDHTFVDAGNNSIVGKSDCVAAWQGFFGTYPDYRNVFTCTVVRHGCVVMTGYSVCTDPDLAGPAVWRATVRDGKVTEWRVYDDTADTRRRLVIE